MARIQALIGCIVKPDRLGTTGLFLLIWMCTVPMAIAQFSETIAYQGYLTDNEGVALDGSFEMAFQLFDAEVGGTHLWTEIHQDVMVEEGVFSVQLGSSEPLDVLPLEQPLFLEIVFGEGGLVLSPRLRLTAVPYSLRAGSLDDEAIAAGENITVERQGDALKISAIQGEVETPTALAAPDGSPDQAILVDDEGRVGIGTTINTTIAPLHIRRNAINLPFTAIANPGLIVEANDATVGIYSSEAGTFGSALELAEINEDGLVLVDKWSLVRETSTGNGLSRLRFTYGSNPNYSLNSSLMTLLPQGFVGVGTDNPEGLLHVSDVGDAELILEADTGNRRGFEDRNPSITLRQDGNRANAFIAMEGQAGTRASGTLDNALVIGSEDNDPALQFVTNDVVRMTIDQDGAISTQPRTSTLSISALMFVPARPDYKFRKDPLLLRPDGSLLFPEIPVDQAWYAPVQLPDGVTVTAATSFWFDIRSPQQVFIRLMRERLLSEGSESETMAILSSNSAAGDGSRTDDSIQHATIDNEAFDYYVHVEFPEGSNILTMGFKQVKIEYTTTQIH